MIKKLITNVINSYLINYNESIKETNIIKQSFLIVKGVYKDLKKNYKQ